VMAARIVGADPLIAVDIRTNRLRLARELGATHTIDARRSDPERAIRAITDRGIDYAVETTGDAAIARAAAGALNRRGTLAILTGGSANGKLPDGRRILSVIQGDAVPQKFIPHLIRLWQRGRFPFDRLITFYDFSEINRAIRDSRRGVTIKPVLRIA